MAPVIPLSPIICRTSTRPNSRRDPCNLVLIVMRPPINQYVNKVKDGLLSWRGQAPGAIPAEAPGTPLSLAEIRVFGIITDITMVQQARKAIVQAKKLPFACF